MKNNINKKKAIVTGCAGFIGSNLVDKLLLNNYQVIGIDNLVTGQIKFINNSFKMPYCTIDEAWGKDFNKKVKRHEKYVATKPKKIKNYTNSACS